MILSPSKTQKEKIPDIKEDCSPPLIRLNGLVKWYAPPIKGRENIGLEPVYALNGIDLSIDSGDYVAFVGPSGSGKSTLMQILGLLDRPSSGDYSFQGQKVSALSDEELAYFRSRYIGFVFQFFNLLSKTSALENVALPLIYSRSKNCEERAKALLEQLGLGERLHHAPHQLSGGQQQRVAIARALVSEPKIVFADEPTGNVNQEQARDILEQLDLLHQTGVTIVLVTHDPMVATRAARVIRMVDGRILSDDRQRALRPVGKKALLPEIKKTSWSTVSAVGENFRMAIKSLQLNKLRTSLTLLGIVIGVAAVISMVALGSGARLSIEERLRSLGSNVLNLRPGSPKLGRVRGIAGSFTRITLDDSKAIEDLRQAGVPIEGLSAEVSGNVQIVRNEKNWNTRLLGETANYGELHEYQPAIGRFFTNEENTTKSRVCLLGKTVYENLYLPGENPVGTFVRINRILFKVIGILPPKGSNSFSDRDDQIMVPLLTAMRRVLGYRYLQSVDIQLSRQEASDEVTVAIAELLRKRHRVQKNQEDDFTIRNMTDVREALMATSRTMSVLLGAIAAISLMVGGIGIMNIMLVSVKERTREIGLRKAIGARKIDVLLQFLIEAVVIGLIGGGIGISVGIFLSWAITFLAGWETKLSMGAVALSFFFSFVVGIFFGFWPARQASSLSPIAALRYE